MHIDQQILIVDGDLNQISLFEVRQSLILSHVRGKIPRLYLAGIDSCLVASDFLYCPEKNTFTGKKLGIGLLCLGSGTSKRYGCDEPQREHRESPENMLCHKLPFGFRDTR